MERKTVYLAMLQLVNGIARLRLINPDDKEIASCADDLFKSLAVVLDHMESCPNRRHL